MPTNKTSTSTLSTTSTSSSSTAHTPALRFTTLEPIKPKSTNTTYPRARPRQRQQRSYSHTVPARAYSQTQPPPVKSKKSLPRKILSGSGKVLGFCAWVLCFSCVLSGGREFDEKHPHQRL
ncbi:hypothetical protein L873DRAFT_1821243 [Choiromyces venosus 120613-1]|uniref:Uncharacterized protein n=1 Tax=Choiromyces venosus 120613-1 TaxID=1336337 RepID=A0A3N4IWL9_9PEZI|nr:hypothetical protein L873DRAFT_1821243 [Choiromyces venosus 120613-1]